LGPAAVSQRLFQTSNLFLALTFAVGCGLFRLLFAEDIRHRDNLAAFRNADLFAVTLFKANAGRLAGLRIDQGNVRDVDPRFLFEDAAFLIELRNRLFVTLHQHRALDLDLAVAGIDRDHPAAERLALAVAVIAVEFAPGDKHHLVTPLDLALYCS